MFKQCVRNIGPALLLAVLAGALQLRASEPIAASVPIPPADQILSRLQKEHPRLLATQADFAQLKKRVAEEKFLGSWAAKLREQGGQILRASPSKYEIPDGLRLLETSRRVMNRVYTLALLYRLEGDARYAERAWQELDAAAKFPDWNPRHFLDTAEMTHAFAIAYDWLYDVWTPDQREALRQAMVEKGFGPALKIYRAHSGWSRARHNWNQVCNGGIGMGALALADVEPQMSGEILHEAMGSIQLAMAEFAPDGAWQEGPGYWNYATMYNVTFLAGLQTALGTDFGLSRIPGFADTGLFPLYLTGPLGRTFNYADGGDRSIRAAQMFWLARQFNQPVYAWYECQHAAPSAQDLVWFDGNGKDPKTAGLPLDKYFRGAEVVALRSDWQDPRAWFIGFKAGDNKANHSHLDLGSFVFDALGVRWAMDLGADNYNLPGYFGGKRWDYYRLRAEGQNTLVINPSTAPDQDPKAAGRILRFNSTPDRAFAIADLSAAYAKHTRKVWRGLALLERNRFLVQDEIQAGNPTDVWWFMHTPASVKLEHEGRVALLEQAGVQLRAEILSPADGTFQLRDAEPLPESPHPEKQGRNDKVRKLAVHLEGVTDSRLCVLFAPASEDAAKSTPPKLSPLSDW